MPQGHLHISRFTCYRCKKRVDLESGLQPEGWERVVMSSPPLADPDETKYDFLLCEECAPMVLKLVQGQDVRLFDPEKMFSVDVGDLDLGEAARRVQGLLRQMSGPKPGPFEVYDDDGFLQLKYDCTACQQEANGETVSALHDHEGAHDEPDCFHFVMTEGAQVTSPVCGETGPTRKQTATAEAKVTCQSCRQILGLDDPLPPEPEEEDPYGDDDLEAGRVLASAREDLIARGVNPDELLIPAAPPFFEVEYFASLSEFAGKDFLLIQEHSLKVLGREARTSDKAVVEATADRINWQGPRPVELPKGEYVAHYSVGKRVALCGFQVGAVDRRVGVGFTRHYDLVTCKACLKAAAVPMHGADEAEGGFVHKADVPAEHMPADPRPICATYEYAGHQEPCQPYVFCDRCGSDTCPGRFYGGRRCTMREGSAPEPEESEEPTLNLPPEVDRALRHLANLGGLDHEEIKRAAAKLRDGWPTGLNEADRARVERTVAKLKEWLL